MGILYILSVFIMLVLFVLVKKSDNKISFVNTCILSIVTYFGFNILVCMVFGVMNITTNLLFLSIVNLVMSGIFGLKIFKDKTIQEFEFRKKDFIALVIISLMVCYIALKQYKPLSDTIANASVDASMHYSAATNFADNMKVLAKIDNQTGYNFKTMQTGAYINNGILISVIRSVLPNFQEIKSFKLFEIGIMYVGILTFYMLVSDKLDTKFKFTLGMVLTILYGFGYPLTSLLYGFSYLSVSIMFAIGLFYMAKIYNTKEMRFIFWMPITVIMCVGIIFSYCLFVPALYAFICIYMFVKDLKDENEKKFLKVFSLKTIITTSVLLVVTVLSILYLVIPTFTDSDQNKLTDAIGFIGQNYNGFIIDFVFYIPFVILFVYKTIKDKKLDYKQIALILTIGQTILSLLGVLKGFVSAYYYYKIYYVLWILLVSCTIEVAGMFDDNKEVRVMITSLVSVWVCIIYLALSGAEIKVNMKSPMMMNSYKLQSMAGIYFDTNIEMQKNIEASCIVNADRVNLAEALGNVEGVTLKNMIVGGMNTNHKAWVYVISGIDCGGESINDLQKAVDETNVEDFLKNDEKQYFVLFDEANTYENTDDYEVVFSNNAGVILKKVNK